MNISFVMYKGIPIFSNLIPADRTQSSGVDDNDAFGLFPASRTNLESARDDSLPDTVEGSDNDRYRIFWTGTDFERTRSLAHAVARLWRTIVSQDTANRNARLRPIIVNIGSTTVGVFVSKRHVEWHFEVCIVEVRHGLDAEMTEESRGDNRGDHTGHEDSDQDITKDTTDSDTQSNEDVRDTADDEEANASEGEANASEGETNARESEANASEGGSIKHVKADCESYNDRGEGRDDHEEASSRGIVERQGDVESPREGTDTFEKPPSATEEERSSGYDEMIEKGGNEEGGPGESYEEGRPTDDSATIRNATSEDYLNGPELWQISNIGGILVGATQKLGHLRSDVRKGTAYEMEFYKVEEPMLSIDEVMSWPDDG
ncbi:hypothetical protein EYR38_009743 [Pleurotus pulmonarius]|nr:hypothetical protein EYR38_009743 [Pleurotus pulmonarius]